MKWFNRKLLSVALAVSLGSLKFMYDYGVEVGKHQADQQIEAYLEKINSLQERLKKAQKNVNVQVVTQYVDRIKTIVKKEKEYVHEATNDVPSEFTVSVGWVYLHDIAATGGDADPTLSSNGSSSGIKDNIALATIVENYEICEQNSEQLKELQKWLTDTKNLIDLNDKVK
jgi:phosphomannomutase